MPTIALVIGETKQKGQILGRIIKSGSGSEVKKIPLVDGAMITFSGNI